MLIISLFERLMKFTKPEPNGLAISSARRLACWSINAFSSACNCAALAAFSCNWLLLGSSLICGGSNGFFVVDEEDGRTTNTSRRRVARVDEVVPAKVGRAVATAFAGRINGRRRSMRPSGNTLVADKNAIGLAGKWMLLIRVALYERREVFVSGRFSPHGVLFYPLGCLACMQCARAPGRPRGRPSHRRSTCCCTCYEARTIQTSIESGTHHPDVHVDHERSRRERVPRVLIKHVVFQRESRPPGK